MAQKTMVKVTQREREIARELAEFKYNLTIKYEREEERELAQKEIDQAKAEANELKSKLELSKNEINKVKADAERYKADAKKSKIDIARNMKEKGYNSEEISILTGLAVKEIEKLKNKP